MNMQPVLPPTLKKADTIAVISPSRWVEKNILLAGKQKLENLGYKVQIHPQCNLRWHQFAGTETKKLSALHEVFTDRNINAIIVASGGSRALHLLDGIDYSLIKANPKIIMGYSDTTAILNAITHKTGLITYHGLSVSSFGQGTSQMNIDTTIKVLSGQKITYPMESATPFHTGIAEGILIGGNLCLLHNLIGTEYLPDLTNKILFFEDDGEEIRNIDRMFLHLHRGANIEKVAGIIIGKISDVRDTGSRPYGLTLYDIISEHTKGMNIPICINAPFGHREENQTLPIGGKAYFKITDSDIQLRLV